MASIDTTQYQLADGNNNAAGLASITGITPSGDRAFFAPVASGEYDPGEFLTRGDATQYTSGFATIVWRFSHMTRAQHEYLMNTYGDSGYSGLVTVRTVTDNDDTFANYNATIRIPKLADLQHQAGWYINVPIRFVKLEAL